MTSEIELHEVYTVPCNGESVPAFIKHLAINMRYRATSSSDAAYGCYEHKYVGPKLDHYLVNWCPPNTTDPRPLWCYTRNKWFILNRDNGLIAPQHIRFRDGAVKAPGSAISYLRKGKYDEWLAWSVSERMQGRTLS